MEVSQKLKEFIEENINLIEQDTEESWEQVYKSILMSSLTGELSEFFLTMNIDPVTRLLYIPSSFLYKSTKIDSYVIPEGIRIIPFRAFFECTSLHSVVFPKSVKIVRDESFSGSNIGSAPLHDVKIIEGDGSTGAFSSCHNLKSVYLDSIISIGNRAFNNCENLSKVYLGEDLTHIGYNSFGWCPNLHEIEYNGTIKDWNKIYKNISWDRGSRIQKIMCTDGVIEL